MTATPQRVTDELFQLVQAHYSAAEMVEMAAVIALENYRSRFNRCFGVEPRGAYAGLEDLLAAVGLPAPEAARRS